MDDKIVQKIVAYIGLAALCVATIAAVLPVLDRYIDDPNLIAYFNHDESFLMGLIWYYYSGQKSQYYQFSSDYGVEMLYIADLARSVPSRFMVFTPGKFVLIMRWLQLIFWILSLAAVWRLVRRHLGSAMQGLAVAGILAVNAGLPFVIHSTKPDPIALFFTLLGLDYALRLLDNHSKPYMVIAVACAALATVIKFSGIFLLPAIIAAIYLSGRTGQDGKSLTPKIGKAWMLPALLGLSFMLLPLISIFSYVRQSSGMTWYKEFGLMGSILRNRSILFMNILGAVSIASSFILYSSGKKASRFLGIKINAVNELLSSSAFITMLFICFALVFGYKWLINPAHFIATYSVMIPIFFDGIMKSSSLGGSLSALVANFIAKIKDFNLPILMLFFFYLFMEIKNWREDIRIDRVKFFKRLTLASFVIPIFPAMFFISHMKWYHMMPFFAVFAILAMQIPSLYLKGRVFPRRVATGIIFICFATSLLYNGWASFKAFRGIYEWRKDKVFKIVKWWNESYPETTPIVADNPLFVYVPPRYGNVRYLRSQVDRSSQLDNMVKDFKPRVICYNTYRMPPIEDMLSNTRVKLVAEFDDPSRFYPAESKAKYVIYELTY